jgi:hypothetical protein
MRFLEGVHILCRPASVSRELDQVSVSRELDQVSVSRELDQVSREL